MGGRGGCAVSDELDWECTMDDGTLTIDTVLMHCPAFAVLDVAKLWDGPPQRGEDLKIPGRPGVLPNPRRADAGAVDLRLVIDGRFDRLGDEWPLPAQGLLENVLWLRENVTDPTYTGDGTRTVTLTSPDGSRTFTGPAHVSMKPAARVGPVQRAILTLSLPDGALELTP